MFGEAPESPQNELTPCRPTNPYAIAKLAAHQLVGAMREHDGLHASSGILFNHESERRPEHFVTRRISRARRSDRARPGERALARLAGRGARLVLRGRHRARRLADAPAGASRRTTCSPAASGTRSPNSRAVAFACVDLDAERYIRVDDGARARARARPRASATRRRPARELGWEPERRFEQLVERMVRADLRSLQALGATPLTRPSEPLHWPRLRTIGVIGLGYVGLPLAVVVRPRGLRGDRGRRRRAQGRGDRGGRSPTSRTSRAEELAEVRERLESGTRYAPLRRRGRGPDLRARRRSAATASPTSGRWSRPAARSRACCVRASSSSSSRRPTPARRASALLPLLEESGLSAGPRLPPRLLARARRPGPHRLHDAQHAEGRRRPHRGLRRARGELYEIVCDEIVSVSSPEAAELTKLLENVFRSVNIALVNELAMLTDRMGIDVWEVVDAAATKPYGFMRFEPGPGHGRALPAGRSLLPELAGARVRHGRPSSSSSPGKINQQMPYHCVAKAQRALNDRGLAVKGARIAIVGVSYKPGVGDIRESPALKIISLLRELGAEVVYHDPHVARAGRSSASRASPFERGDRRRRPGADRDRPPRRRPRRDRPRAPGSSSTCAASRARATPRTSCGCERPAAGAAEPLPARPA